MLTQQEMERAKQDAINLYDRAGIILTQEEKENIEIADFGMSDINNIGLFVVVYINTERVCAKELAMSPGQTCPEHRHPNIGNVTGKEETFRCRYGKVYLYVSGEKNAKPNIQGLDDYAEYLCAAHEIVLYPGEQYTLMPDTLHWFRAGNEGAVVSEFSTTSTDELDVFTDPRVKRATVIGD